MCAVDANNVHRILYKHEKWTHSYWDECASLSPILPKGPIAILGLGGGTAAHLMLDLWPELQLEGWEIDQIVTTWLEIKKWLMPNGRIMVNCGGTTEGSNVDPRSASSNCTLVQNSTIEALSEAFAGEICSKKVTKGNRENHPCIDRTYPRFGFMVYFGTRPSKRHYKTVEAICRVLG